MKKLKNRAKERLKENQVPPGRLTPLGTALILGVTDLWEKPRGRRVKPEEAWFCREVLSALERLDRVELELNRREGEREREREEIREERDRDRASEGIIYRLSI